MLLDKNKDLDEEKEVLRQQFEQTVFAIITIFCDIG